MKRAKTLLAALGVLALMLCGCSRNGATGSGGSVASGSGGSIVVPDASFASNPSEMFTDRDYEVGHDESQSALIQLNGDSAVCSSDAVRISGTTVTITDEGTYVLTGTLNNGMIIVNAGENDKPQLVLNGASITSATSAALYILEADKVFVTLADGTSNSLVNGGAFTAIDDNNIDAAVFSKQDLTLNGAGSLTVTSPAGHGIVSKDDLAITSGTYIVNSASHGLDANDSVRIANAALTIHAGKDGIHAENTEDTTLGFVYITNGTLDIEAQGDGISAEAYMQFEDGSYDILAGGGSENGEKQSSDSWGGMGGGGMGGGGMGEPGRPRAGYTATAASTATTDTSTSMKGLKSTGSLLVSGGTFTIDSADDAVHSNTSVIVNGGCFAIETGDDGFHADETLAITAGEIKITESYEGLEALSITISGGDIQLVCRDDGINAAGGKDSSGLGGYRGNDQFGGPGGGMGGSSGGSIEISGGSIYMNASGDGIDANGTLTISGGTVTVCGPTTGDTSVLDYDRSGVITGGTFIGTGASQMAQTFSASEQGVISVNAGNQSAGTSITLKDSKGNTLISCSPKLSFAIVILSSPDIVKGETYTLTVGSTSGKATAS